MRENKSLLAQILDAALFFVILTVLLFLPIRTANSTLDSLASAVALTVAIGALAKAGRGRKKAERATLSKGIKACKTLTYLDARTRLNHLASALSRFGEVEICDGYLTAEKKRVYPVFVPDTAFASRLCRIYEQCVAANEKAVIVTPSSPDKASLSYIEGGGRLKVLSGEKLYKLAADMSLPESDAPKERGRLKKLLNVATQRSLFRRYLMSGALLIGASYIMPRSVLYLAIGALCIFLAIVTLLPKRKKS